REPRNFRAFDKTWAQANHLPINVSPGSHRRPGRCSRSRRDRIFSTPPDSIVPLTDKSGPFLDRQVVGLRTSAESGSLIAVPSRCKKLDPIEISRRQINRLAVCQNCVRPGRRREVEPNSTKTYLTGQQLCRQCFSLRCTLVVRRPIKGTVGGTAHPGSDRHFVVERNRLEIHRVNLCPRRPQFDRKRSRLISLERSHQLTVPDCRRTKRLFLSVHFSSGQDRRWETNPNICCAPAVHFNQTHNPFIARLCFFQRHDPNSLVVKLN